MKPKQNTARKQWLKSLSRDHKAVVLTEECHAYLYTVSNVSVVSGQITGYAFYQDSSITGYPGYVGYGDHTVTFNLATGREIQGKFGGSTKYLVPLNSAYKQIFEIREARYALTTVLSQLSGNVSKLGDAEVLRLLAELKSMVKNL